jgi:serine O-acetyltransferase
VEIGVAARADLAAICERDPACQSPLEALLFFKGFHAIQTYRYAHTLLRQHRRALAQFLQSRSALVFGVDINPALCSAPALGCSATSRLELAPRSERAVWS